jgi:hypothetical protein
MGISNSYRAALGLGASALALTVGANPARATDFIGGDTLLISTTTYQDVGEVANLVAGVSQLPGANAGETSTAVSNGQSEHGLEQRGRRSLLRRHLGNQPLGSQR